MILTKLDVVTQTGPSRAAAGLAANLKADPAHQGTGAAGDARPSERNASGTQPPSAADSDYVYCHSAKIRLNDREMDRTDADCSE